MSVCIFKDLEGVKENPFLRFQEILILYGVFIFGIFFFFILPPISYVKLDLPPVFIIIKTFPCMQGKLKELYNNGELSQRIR